MLDLRYFCNLMDKCRKIICFIMYSEISEAEQANLFSSF